MNIFLVAIGGAIGSIARYLLSEAVINLNKNSYFYLTKFPTGTFVVNILGSMLAGIAYYFVIKNFNSFDPRLKNFLFTGFLAGFTTFSTFCLDFFRLAVAGQYLQASVYVIASVIIAVTALFFGFYMAKLIF